MNREQLQELACLHALGALTPEEARAFEEQLQRDPELQALHKELQGVTAGLAANVKQVAPPAHLKERILAATAGSGGQKIVSLPRPDAERGLFSNWLPWALAASLAIFAGALWMRPTPRTQVVLLNSLVESAPKAVAVSIWDPNKKEGELIVQNLAPLAWDKDYQLWIIDPKSKAPIDAGVFTVDEKGGARIRFKPRSALDTAGTFAVTLEKKGGVPAPEGTMVLAGTVN